MFTNFISIINSYYGNGIDKRVRIIIRWLIDLQIIKKNTMKKYYNIISAMIVATIAIYNITCENVKLDFLTNDFESLADPDGFIEKGEYVRGQMFENWLTRQAQCDEEDVAYEIPGVSILGCGWDTFNYTRHYPAGIYDICVKGDGDCWFDSFPPHCI